MLQITDINTSTDNFEEVERLKAEFRALIEPTVKEGSLIIISNFPPVGSSSGAVDHMILFMLNKRVSNNYLQIPFRNKNYYTDSFVFLIKKINDIELINANSQFVYTKDGAFDYVTSLKQLNREYDSFFERIETVICFSCYNYISKSDYRFSNLHLYINTEITAKSILRNIAEQYSSRFDGSRINSFSKERMSYYEQDILTSIARNIVEESNKATKFGIITKKKLDLISRNIKLIDEIYDNVGKVLSIIKGKAGTGKTLTLSRIIHKHVSEKHRVRFLTFNNLLVFDVKQNLKNFDYYGDPRINVDTVHKYFRKLSDKLGISLILSEDRIKQVLDVCEKRIEKFRGLFSQIALSPEKCLNEQWLLKEISKTEKNKADYNEFMEFAKFLTRHNDLRSFDKVKEAYLERKRSIIQPHIGNKVFLEDYYKVLELILLAVTDDEKFFEEMKIKDRYELLAAWYNADKDEEQANKEISLDTFKERVKSLSDTTKWSTLVIVDEAQDFHVLEKEILFQTRGSENIIVASGGKEQLIRHNALLDWSVSLGKKIPSSQHNLSGGSYRQKQNIVEFVNKFGALYGFDLGLKSASENKGLGKVIIDTRKKEEILPEDIANELKVNGEVNGCSPYESMLILIPSNSSVGNDYVAHRKISKSYTTKTLSTSFNIDDKDYLKETKSSTGRKIQNLDKLAKLGILGWDGVSENKGQLRTPYQNETRVIHYESCRGLEAWSCACVSVDDFFYYKRAVDEAGDFMSDDLFLTEQERRDKFAAIWCLMAFTRPIDTLYIHIEDTGLNFSKRIIEVAKGNPGTVIIE